MLRKVLSYEARMWRSAYRWAFRRPVAGPGATAFGGSKPAVPIMWFFVVLSAVELFAVDLLVRRWPGVRVAALVLGVYGLLWMVGLLASMMVHPHLVEPAGVRVRHGLSVDFLVPWSALETVRTRRRSFESGRSVQVDERAVNIVVLSQTNVDLVLREPMSFNLPQGPGPAVTEVRVHADDPDGFTAAIRAHLTARADR